MGVVRTMGGKDDSSHVVLSSSRGLSYHCLDFSLLPTLGSVHVFIFCFVGEEVLSHGSSITWQEAAGLGWLVPPGTLVFWYQSNKRQE